MKNEIDYLKMVAQNGGPSTTQYQELDSIFYKIWHKQKEDNIPFSYLNKVMQNIGPAFSNDTMQGFVVNQPHGYAGDYEIIDRIYSYWLSPRPELINWDYYFHSRKAPKAVRNRKDYFKNQVSSLCTNKSQNYNILNIGSGPCRDVLEFYDSYGCSNVFFDCVDIDENSINYAKKLCKNFLSNIKFHNQNILRYKADKLFSIIWSAGLFDYLDDRFFKLLLKRLGKMTSSPGEIIIGNFSDCNPTRYYMESGGWLLNHRSEDQLFDLALQAGFNKNQIQINNESEKVNLFMHIKI